MNKPASSKQRLAWMRGWTNIQRSRLAQIDAAIEILKPVSASVARDVHRLSARGTKPSDTASRELGVRLREAVRALRSARRGMEIMVGAGDERVDEILGIRRM